jgi:predicted lipoprotein with Yx(FWY)xxD motif
MRVQDERMSRISKFLVAALLALAGCGSDEDSDTPSDRPPKQAAATNNDGEAPQTQPAKPTAGTTITLGDSEFGRMLFDTRKQAIYIFENDPKGKTVCYGECAEAWPPVFTKGNPKAGEGVNESLLGTVKRGDGRLQVTYAGKPLYFYAHEGPGEVRCHNVDLNGGLWWVVGPNGRRRP